MASTEGFETNWPRGTCEACKGKGKTGASDKDPKIDPKSKNEGERRYKGNNKCRQCVGYGTDFSGNSDFYNVVGFPNNLDCIHAAHYHAIETIPVSEEDIYMELEKYNIHSKNEEMLWNQCKSE